MSREHRTAGSRALAAALVAVMLAAAALLACGCQPNTPEAAVRNFLNARDTNNWGAFLASVLPDNVRKMSQADIQAWKQTLKQASKTLKFNVGSLKMKTTYTNPKKTKANVRLTAGTIKLLGTDGKERAVLNIGTSTLRQRNPQTGKMEVIKIEGADKQQMEKELLVYKTELYKVRWYVDVTLQGIAQQQEGIQMQ